MGVSTDAMLCRGIEIPEGYVFPWNKEDEDGNCDKGCEDWWLYGICKYKPSFEIYDDTGNRLAGFTESDMNKYYEEMFAFKTANPMPFEVVYHCSAEYPMYIIAIPKTTITSSRGDVTELDMEFFYKNSSKDVDDAFVELCKKYFPSDEDYEINYKPGWLMVSYWG